MNSAYFLNQGESNTYLSLRFLWKRASILGHKKREPSLTQGNRDAMLLNYIDSTPKPAKAENILKELPKSSERQTAPGFV